jgi:hypothetical protein
MWLEERKEKKNTLDETEFEELFQGYAAPHA